MGTKPYYFLILVALTIGFVLIPTGKAESEIEDAAVRLGSSGYRFPERHGPHPEVGYSM